MVVLNKIYTKTGDAGETALGDGSRVAKHSLRVTAYGTVDELNSTLGLARLHADDALGGQLSTVQNDLFDLGADLCTPNMERDAEREYPPLRIVVAQVERLEREIDAMNARLTPCAASSCRAERHSPPICTCAAPWHGARNGWSWNLRPWNRSTPKR
jgi:cob(I)alamin adenosyltransferase